MREIKFRVWDKKVKCFFLPKLEVQESGENTFTFGFSSKVQYPDNYPLMQYTGLKDKNGVEIFEGDIVKAEKSVFQSKNPLEVKFGFYHSIDEVEYGWYVKGKFESSIVWEDKTKLDYLEVIGNIYENPELLN